MPFEIALVTGAGSGIGAAVALALAKRGSTVAVLDRDAHGAERTVQAIKDAGGRSHPVVADVTDDESMDAATKDVQDMWGPVNTVVAAAGIETLGDVTTVEPDAWSRTLQVNVTGVFLTARHTVPQLRSAGGGSFIAIASDAGIKGSQGYAAYSASKHAVIGLIKCMALDHGPEGVRSNAVCPGFVETPMTERIFASGLAGDPSVSAAKVPLGRFAAPGEVASAVAYLSSAEASYVNGMVYLLDGGSNAGQYRATSSA